MNITATTTPLADYIEAALNARPRSQRFPVQVTEGIGSVSFTVDTGHGPVVLHCMGVSNALTGPATGLAYDAVGWAVTFGTHVPHAVVLAAFLGAVADAGVTA